MIIHGLANSKSDIHNAFSLTKCSDGLLKGEGCECVYSVRLHLCSLPDVETQIRRVTVILFTYSTGTAFCTPVRSVMLCYVMLCYVMLCYDAS
jgi:hypothetical protein